MELYNTRKRYPMVKDAQLTLLSQHITLVCCHSGNSTCFQLHNIVYLQTINQTTETETAATAAISLPLCATTYPKDSQ